MAIFGSAMPARWAGGPQPNAIPIIDIATKKVEHLMLDDQRLVGGTVMDIHPGESEVLDVMVRFTTDQDCYGWNNESYFLQPPAQPRTKPEVVAWLRAFFSKDRD